MCGIIGYVGTQHALPILSKGLANLEYRGYDSAGISLAANGTLDIFKQQGEVADLELPDDHNSTLGIGHTRWSTHGKPTDENAHPHTDCSGRVSVVHNGIIENYEELKAELIEDGHTFTSETDTEVVPHLVERELETGIDLPEAVANVVDRLDGSYAIGVVTPDFDGIVAARVGSPLVLGHGDDGNFIASDVPAFIEHTNRVSYLEDGDIAIVTREGIEVQQHREPVDRSVEEVDWDAEAAEKGGYEHYMLKEIHEQPDALRQALSGRVDDLLGEVDLELDLPVEYLNSLEEIQIVACGTSYHAGLYAAKLLEEYAEVRVTPHIASEYSFSGGRDPWRTLVIAVTQSGETADTLSAMRTASRNGAKTLAVTNTVGSTAAREADEALYIRAGPEIGVAATKTFVSQVTTLTMFAVDLGRVRDTLTSSRASDILANVRDLPGAVQQVLDQEDRIRDVAREYAESDAFFFIGRYLGHPVALEGALKLKEISYDHAEGFAAGELKHGTLALVTEDTPVIAVLTEGAAPDATRNNVKEVESRGAPVIGCTSIDGNGLLDESFVVPDIGIVEPIVANVYMQLFAYYVARVKDRPIDKPRNLAKSVTVE